MSIVQSQEKNHSFILDCVHEEWIGDGYCNDETNNADCNYDDGDCCGSCVNKEYCSECSCLSEVTVTGQLNPLIGNGFCNPEINNAECMFDGLDCCGSDVNLIFCTEQNDSECSCYGIKIKFLVY